MDPPVALTESIALATGTVVNMTFAASSSGVGSSATSATGSATATGATAITGAAATRAAAATGGVDDDEDDSHVGFFYVVTEHRHDHPTYDRLSVESSSEEEGPPELVFRDEGGLRTPSDLYTSKDSMYIRF